MVQKKDIQSIVKHAKKHDEKKEMARYKIHPWLIQEMK